ncbi:MAG: SDR family oxidoreductase [Candidatus Helarchaeota archaeon]
MDLNGKKILVTGAAGFIGSNLVSKLLTYDSQIIGLDNFSTGRRDYIEKFRKNHNFLLIEGDIRDFNFLQKKLKKIDIIFHEAALSSVIRSVEDPRSSHEVNVTGTLNLLLIAKELNIERFVFASSSSVYGEKKTLPKQEDMPLSPFSPYGVSKLAAEKYVYSFYKIYGVNIVSLRYFNVYGPNQVASPYSGVISIFISRILQNQSPIIFGDGTQTRDFTFVKDVVEANLLAATKKTAIGRVFNIATGKRISILELAQMILKLCNKSQIKIQFQPPRAGDILHSLADITLAKKFLNYFPQFDLQQGLRETIDWFQSKRTG